METDNQINNINTNLTSLTPEQETFIKYKSIGARFMSPSLYLSLSFPWNRWSTKLNKEYYVSLLPLGKELMYFKMIRNGRRLVWEKGKWESFQAYHKKQQIVDYVGLAELTIFLVFVIYFILGHI